MNELEVKWGIKRSPHDYMQIEVERLPSELLVLVPYIEFFCVDDQFYRENFLNTLPQECFVELHEVLSNIELHFLRDWLADDVNFESNIPNWRALATLQQIPGGYL